MSWLRQSDTANDSEVVTAPLAWDPDPAWPALDAAQDMGLMALLLRGLVNACAVRAAGAGRYVIPAGTIAAHARTPHWRLLTSLAEKCGYWTRLEDGSYELIDAPTELYHIVREEEKEWTAQRKADVSNRRLTSAVRHRDGDGCRFCTVIVIWIGDRLSERAGTYHHVVPGQGARSIDELVVACKGCNSFVKDDPSRKPLLPPPADPYYSPGTVAFLAKAGITVQQTRSRRRRGTATSTTEPARTAPADTAQREPATGQPPRGTTAQPPRPAPADNAQRDPATGETPRQQEPATRSGGQREPRPAETADPATSRSNHVDRPKRRSTDPAGRLASGPGLAGSGRGRVGSGAPDHPPGDPSAQNQATPRPRRRGRRGKNRPGNHATKQE